MPPRRRISAHIPIRGHHVQTNALERAADSLREVHNRLRARVEMFRREEEEARDLVQRARLLNERLALVRQKLTMLSHQGISLEGLSLESISGHASSSQHRTPNVLDTLRYVDGVIPESDVPRDFVCPITQMIMIDPVTTCDGHTYERAAIMEWFSHFEGKSAPTSPLTNLPLMSLDLKSNAVLRQEIDGFVKDHQARRQPQQNTKSPALEASNPFPRGSESTTTALVPKVPRDTTPIWGSSVVPTHEPNSRELNALRIQSESSNPIILMEGLEDTTPIWRSSVVPTHEPNSRELNALRVKRQSQIPITSTTTTTTVTTTPGRRLGSHSVDRYNTNLNNRQRFR